MKFQNSIQLKTQNSLKWFIPQKDKRCWSAFCLYLIGSELTLTSAEKYQLANLHGLNCYGAAITVIPGDSTKFKQGALITSGEL